MKKDYIVSPITSGKLLQEYTGKRVSKEGKEKASQLIEEMAQKLTKKTVLLANNDNRKTVKKKDIIYANQQLKFDK